MRNYELTIVLDGKATSAKKKSMAGKIEKLVKDLKGKIVKNDDWGKKDLAYKLGKSDTGVYHIFAF
jgi:small subunit ribosomal protein S6